MRWCHENKGEAIFRQQYIVQVTLPNSVVQSKCHSESDFIGLICLNISSGHPLLLAGLKGRYSSPQEHFWFGATKILNW